MLRFECDYTQGAAPEIMRRLAETNLEQTPGYGEDHYCAAARAKILSRLGRPDAAVHFLVGGTQANLTVIAAALRSYQGVIAASTGHISVHETGAIEACGHKVLPIPSDDGKIAAAQIDALVDAHWADVTHEHQVQPAMVYLSQPTENGTLYTLAELEAIHEACRKWRLLLYVDGARLGYGLAAPGNDVTLPDLARLTDAFYIGGTKVGALFGEAVVLLDKELQRDFRYHIKQRGGMFAKGRLLGLQFDELFSNGLYERLGRHAVELAMELRRAFEAKGISLRYDSPTNQQFPILTQAQYEALAERYAFSLWEDLGERTAVRFSTSWATDPAAVAALVEDIQGLGNT